MRSPFERIPGVGPAMSKDLERLGFQTVDDLVGQNPEELYERLMVMDNQHIDRCVLYVFRCAVYYASSPEHDPEKLKWWNWKDDKLAAR